MLFKFFYHQLSLKHAFLLFISIFSFTFLYFKFIMFRCGQYNTCTYIGNIQTLLTFLGNILLNGHDTYMIMNMIKGNSQHFDLKTEKLIGNDLSQKCSCYYGVEITFVNRIALYLANLKGTVSKEKYLNDVTQLYSH